MPFTFSHPAAVLPLTYFPKRWVSITGLVVGSMSPDFECFLRMKAYSIYSHTWTGLFWFDLPLTIFIAFLFHLIVRDKLIDYSPSFFVRRFTIFKNLNWIEYFKQNFLIVIISAIVGISTHILWDGFTHKQGQFVQMIDGLNNTFSIAGFTIPIYKLLQHISTIIGGIVIIYVLFKLPKYNVVPNQKSIFPFWISVIFIAFVIVLIRLLTGLDYQLYGDVLITLMSGGFIGILLTTIFFPKRL